MPMSPKLQQCDTMHRNVDTLHLPRALSLARALSLSRARALSLPPSPPPSLLCLPISEGVRGHGWRL